MRIHHLALVAGMTLALAQSAEAAGRGGSVLSRAGNSFGNAGRSVASGTRNAAGAVGREAANADVTVGIKIEKKYDGVYNPKIGKINGEGNGRRGCEGGLAVLSGSANASLGYNRAAPSSGPRAANGVNRGRETSREAKTGGKCGALGQAAGAGVEGSLVSVSGECATAAGTFGGKVNGAAASATINLCKAELKADLIYGEVSYESPSISGCGVSASAVVTAGAGVGLGVGVQRVGTVGGGGRIGPVKVGVGANVKIDGKGVAKCAKDAVKKVGGFFKGLFGGAKKVLQAVGEAQIANANSGMWFTP